MTFTGAITIILLPSRGFFTSVIYLKILVRRVVGAGIILAHTSILIWKEILKPYMSEKQLIGYLVITLLSPMIGLGSLIMTPDIPLVFCWSLATLFILRSLAQPTLKNYVFLGAALGLGFCSKYNIVLLPVISVLFLWWSRKLSLLRWSYIPILILAAFIFSLPVWIWNSQNQFDSFLFQMSHGLGQSQWNPTWTTNYILEQIAIIFPVCFIIALKYRPTRATSWLLFWAWIPVLFFVFTSFRGRVEANWPAVAYPAIYALMILAVKDWKWVKFTAITWAIAAALAISEIQFSWLPTTLTKIKVSEFRVYDTLVPVARSYTPFFASSYQMAAVLSYKLRTPIYKLKDMGRRSYYEYVENSLPLGPSFFIALREWDQLPPWTKEYEIVQKIPINSEFRLLELRKL